MILRGPSACTLMANERKRLGEIRFVFVANYLPPPAYSLYTAFAFPAKIARRSASLIRHLKA